MQKQENKKLETEIDSFVNYNNHLENDKNTFRNENLKKNDTLANDYANFTKTIDEITLFEEGLENDFTTAILYHKLQFEEAMSAFYAFAAIVTAIISYEGKKTNGTDYENYQIFTLAMVSIFNILFCKTFINIFK